MTERPALNLRHVLSPGDAEALATLMSELEWMSRAADSIAYAWALLFGSRASSCNAGLWSAIETCA